MATMPTDAKIAEVLNNLFRKQAGYDMDKAMLSWLVFAFKQGYNKGQADFMASHDWYE